MMSDHYGFTADEIYDFDAWPENTNELMVRLHLWWSKNNWLLDGTSETLDEILEVVDTRE